MARAISPSVEVMTELPPMSDQEFRMPWLSADRPLGPEPDEPLFARLRDAPLDGSDGRGAAKLADLEPHLHAAIASAGLADVLAVPEVRKLLGGILAGSPYLSTLIVRDPARLVRLLASRPEQHLDAMIAGLTVPDDTTAVMRTLRLFKTEVALLVALADLGGVWPVMRVTAALTRAADAAVAAAARSLFRQAVHKGEWRPEGAETAEAPERTSGYIVLGMGKHGAHELNYSSDIDLIVFYDQDKARIGGGLEPQAFFVRLTRALVRILQERTGDGYVFRTDLRLRPDPGATQIALSTAAAHYY